MRARVLCFLFLLALSSSRSALAGICVGTLEDCQLVVNFERNSAVLTEEARNRVQAFSRLLKERRLPIGGIMIEGFTDASGNDDYNFALSKRRAHSVVKYLVEQGVDASKLIAKGYGKTHPTTLDPYDPANRRVEVRWSVE